MKREIKTTGAPAPVGPYSQAVEVNGIIYLSGQIGIDPTSGKLKEDLREQTLQALNNIVAILKEAGLGKENLVKLTIYVTDISKFREINDLYEEFFRGIEPKPARVTVGVKDLPLNALIEIEAVAVRW
jgi:2-iminobutanoate/2-iminopropanoate deaminase